MLLSMYRQSNDNTSSDIIAKLENGTMVSIQDKDERQKVPTTMSRIAESSNNAHLKLKDGSSVEVFRNKNKSDYFLQFPTHDNGTVVKDTVGRISPTVITITGYTGKPENLLSDIGIDNLLSKFNELDTTGGYGALSEEAKTNLRSLLKKL